MTLRGVIVLVLLASLAPA